MPQDKPQLPGLTRGGHWPILSPMPEVEPPVEAQPKQHKAWFTPENARIMAARSAARRRAVPFKYPPLAQPLNAQAPDYRLELIEEQVKLTRESLNATDLEPKDRAQLIRGLCGLLDQLRIARGEPMPGSLRPRQAKDVTHLSAWLQAQPRPARSEPEPDSP